MARIPRNDPPPFQTDSTLVCLTMKRARKVETQLATYRDALMLIESALGSGNYFTPESYRNIARKALGLLLI